MVTKYHSVLSSKKKLHKICLTIFQIKVFTQQWFLACFFSRWEKKKYLFRIIYLSIYSKKANAAMVHKGCEDFFFFFVSKKIERKLKENLRAKRKSEITKTRKMVATKNILHSLYDSGDFCKLQPQKLPKSHLKLCRTFFIKPANFFLTFT